MKSLSRHSTCPPQGTGHSTPGEPCTKNRPCTALTYRYLVGGMNASVAVGEVRRAALAALAALPGVGKNGIRTATVDFPKATLTVTIAEEVGVALGRDRIDHALTDALLLAGYALRPLPDSGDTDPAGEEKEPSLQQDTGRPVKEKGKGKKNPAARSPFTERTESDLRALRQLTARQRGRLILSSLPALALLIFAVLDRYSPLSDRLSPLASVSLQWAMVLPAVFFGRKTLLRGARNIRRLAPDSDSFTALGTGTALLSGAVLWFVLLFATIGRRDDLADELRYRLFLPVAALLPAVADAGRLLTLRARTRAAAVLPRRIDVAPQTATRLTVGENPFGDNEGKAAKDRKGRRSEKKGMIETGTETVIPAGEVIPGDLLLCREGEWLAADAVVLSGSGWVDASRLTGEENPQFVGPGDTLCAGVRICGHPLTVRAIAAGSDSLFRSVRGNAAVRHGDTGKVPSDREAGHVPSPASGSFAATPAGEPDNPVLPAATSVDAMASVASATSAIPAAFVSSAAEGEEAGTEHLLLADCVPPDRAILPPADGSVPVTSATGGEITRETRLPAKAAMSAAVTTGAACTSAGVAAGTAPQTDSPSSAAPFAGAETTASAAPRAEASGEAGGPSCRKDPSASPPGPPPVGNDRTPDGNPSEHTGTPSAASADTPVTGGPGSERFYLPALTAALATALLTLILHWVADGNPAAAFRYASAVLIAACPLTLALTAPITALVLTARGIREGILFRHPAAIGATAHVRTVCLEKTGILTETGLSVGDCLLIPEESCENVTVENDSSTISPPDPAAANSPADIPLPPPRTGAPRPRGRREDLLSLAAAVLKGVRDPVAVAIRRRAAEDGLLPPPAEQPESTACGEQALIFGKRCTVIYPTTRSLPASLPPRETAWLAPRMARLRQEGKLPVTVIDDGHLQGILSLYSPVREEAAPTLLRLCEAETDPVLLSADGEGATARVARTVGYRHAVADRHSGEEGGDCLPTSADGENSSLFRSVHADLTPDGKRALLDRWCADRARRDVLTVGNGAGDVPAMLRADVCAVPAGLSSADDALTEDRANRSLYPIPDTVITAGEGEKGHRRLFFRRLRRAGHGRAACPPDADPSALLAADIVLTAPSLTALPDAILLCREAERCRRRARLLSGIPELFVLAVAAGLIPRSFLPLPVTLLIPAAAILSLLLSLIPWLRLARIPVSLLSVQEDRRPSKAGERRKRNASDPPTL